MNSIESYRQAREAVWRLEIPVVMLGVAGGLCLLTAGLAYGLHSSEVVVQEKEALLTFVAMGLGMLEGASVIHLGVVPFLPTGRTLEVARKRKV